MVHKETSLVSAVAMDDELGIVYLIQTAQQFWSELEDVLKLPSNEYQTLALLDAALRRFLALCSAYHEQYLQSPLQLEHAFDLLLDSELFEFHSERMVEIMVDDTKSTTDPHSQFIFYNALYFYGKRRSDSFRSQKRWRPLFPLLMDLVMVDIDPEVEDTYFGGTVGGPQGIPSVPVPIEAKLRAISMKLLYEVCKMQKFSLQELRVFDDNFIDHLYDLVEQTRNMQDDSFNYSVIKLIVALNEQFMVASLGTDSSSHHIDVHTSEAKNRVLRVLMRRLGYSKTFGENMIFMLNRAQRTPEDLCMQLLILKLLYLIFMTKGTSEYFYTNDLCVLVDVFLRELANLDEDSETLRHNYLRVLHPLLTKTQLRDYPYKRPQILYVLESFMSNAKIRDINPTTKRLVERCLSGDWCVQLKARRDSQAPGLAESDNTSESSVTASGTASMISPAARSKAELERANSISKSKMLKFSKSVENLKISGAGGSGRGEEIRPPLPLLDKDKRASNSSAMSLSAIADSKANVVTGNAPSKRRGTAESTIVGGQHTNTHKHMHHRRGDRIGVSDSEHNFHTHHHQLLAPNGLQTQNILHPTSHRTPLSPSSPYHGTPSDQPPTNPPTPTSTSDLFFTTQTSKLDRAGNQPTRTRRPPPAPPTKRRKPPAVPVGKTNGGATITVIRSSAGTG